MKYRMISVSALPLALCVAGKAVMFRKQGDSVEVELRARTVERLARHGAVRFEAIPEPLREAAPEPAEEKTPVPFEPMPIAYTELAPPTTEPSPAAEAGAATE